MINSYYDYVRSPSNYGKLFGLPALAYDARGSLIRRKKCGSLQHNSTNNLIFKLILYLPAAST